MVHYALCIAAATLLASCGEKDELMEEPSWLGNSIYDRLSEEGRTGAFTMFDVPPAYLYPGSHDDLLAHML